MSKVTFTNRKAIFFRTIQANVDRYFEERNLKKTGNSHLYFKTGILIFASISIYVALLTVDFHQALALVLCCLLGMAQAGIGFNVMHDANHGSFSSRKWINGLMGLTLNVLGGNSWLWKQKHNVIHHTYTNVDGVDEDIKLTPLLRMCPSQKRSSLHRYQYLYCVPLYGLTTIMWIFGTDFIKYFQNKIQSTRLRRMTASEHFIFWISKVLYTFFFVALPIYLVGFLPFIIGFLVMHFTLGLTLALVFQLAHVVESTHFVEAHAETLTIEDEWAVHQVRTTANFATGNKIISWYTGGLNFQVEHHLFPHISHVHYPAIHLIVKDACRDFSVRYNQFPSLSAALRSHFRFMKQLGTSAI